MIQTRQPQPQQNPNPQMQQYYSPRPMPGAGPGAGPRTTKQNMTELKLRRLMEYNQRLREDLDRPRIKVSEASTSLIKYTQNTRDYLIPSIWGPVDRKDDPYAPSGGACNCAIM